MLKSAALVTLAAFSAGAQAQDVALYGIVDTGVEYLNHSGPGNTSLVRMPNVTASLPSRFGLRGTEDLGDGLKASFVLENGIALDSGGLNYGGRLFGRQAFVSLGNAYGTLSLGRQYNMTFHALLDSDTLGPNLYALSNLDPYLSNTRSDNAVGYLGKAGGVSFGATVSLGRDAAGPAGPQATNCAGESAADSRACRQVTAMVKYDAPRFGIAASWDKLRGGPNALFGLNSSRYSDTRSTLGGHVKVGTVKIAGGVVHRVNQSMASFDANLVHLGAMVPFGTWAVDGQVARLNLLRSGNDALMLAVRLTCFLSKRTAAYATAGQVRNSGTSALAVSPGATTLAGMDQSGITLGLRHAF
jgi:predicted porin